ncbi:MAG: hypothetical protein PHV34_21545 [Verrucomicrobiae bacterium]|nr:hypothetical protein [Verrucomicrobiae bacterium]
MNDIETQIEKGFEYSGDVTLRCKDGRSVTGFLCNRNVRGTQKHPAPFLEMMLEGQDGKVVFDYSEVESVVLSGDDPSHGKSWEEWVAKHEAMKKALHHSMP